MMDEESRNVKLLQTTTRRR